MQYHCAQSRFWLQITEHIQILCYFIGVNSYTLTEILLLLLHFLYVEEVNMLI